MKLTEYPKTFIYGWYNDYDIDKLVYNDLFSDNVYCLEKVMGGIYPCYWLDDCMKLIVNGNEKDLTEAIMFLFDTTKNQNIKWINYVLWDRKLFFNWESIMEDTLKLDKKVLEKYHYLCQGEFVNHVLNSK